MLERTQAALAIAELGSRISPMSDGLVVEMPCSTSKGRVTTLITATVLVLTALSACSNSKDHDYNLLSEDLVDGWGAPASTSLAIAYDSSATCAKSAVIDVKETPASVTVDIRVWTSKEMCKLDGLVRLVTTTLNAPVGKRAVVDTKGNHLTLKPGKPPAALTALPMGTADQP